jgi:Zn-finger nucleic acid-binding protein
VPINMNKPVTPLSNRCSHCGGTVKFEHGYRSECEYCGTVNTVDLKSLGDFEIIEHEELPHNCPRCKTNDWQAIRLKTQEAENAMHRCNDCHGLFIYHAKLDALLKWVQNAKESNQKLMQLLLSEPIPLESKIQYLDCPVCIGQMHRHNYKSRSGVIVDTCPKHGSWFDGGELGKLLQWAEKNLNKPQVTPIQDQLKEARGSYQYDDKLERIKNQREFDNMPDGFKQLHKVFNFIDRLFT